VSDEITHHALCNTIVIKVGAARLQLNNTFNKKEHFG
jgi:hypothetical protein